MSTRPPHLAPYDPRWPAEYARRAAQIAGAVGAHVRRIEHVGSTAVPGIPLAKPVIDIALAVDSEADADACVAPLQALGWECRGPWGDDPRRRYYVLDEGAGPGARRAAQIHLYILPARAWDEKLAFRDRLRADPALREAYAAEKRRAAEAVAWDKGRYSVEKGPFIERILGERAARSQGLSG